MDWQSRLISIYLTIDSVWNKGSSMCVQRFSNNSYLFLTDQEVVTIYFFGVLQGRSTVKEIFDYANQHLREWFPHLKNYEAFNYRLNKIHSGFITLCELFSGNLKKDGTENWVIDSLPIIMAGPKRSGRARVGRDQADKGYCASKDLFFHGVKLHCIGELRAGTIPTPVFIGLAPASASDEKLFEMVSSELENGKVFADKAYIDSDHERKLNKQNVELLTPLKRGKDKYSFSGGETYSTWVSSVRQPIESFFNWLDSKTKIQKACKVRSSAGLIVHVFGKVAAALLALKLNF